MIFSCEKATLQMAASAAGRAASVKSPNPALEGVLVECQGREVRFTGYDLTTAITTRIEAQVREEGRLVLPARLLVNIIQRLPDDVVTFKVGTKVNGEESETKMFINCVDANYDVSVMPAEDYPDLPKEEGLATLVLEQGKLKDMIARSVYAVSNSDSRPVHNGMLFEAGGGRLTMVAVDGYRMAIRRERAELKGAESLSFVVPGGALRQVEWLCSGGAEPAVITSCPRHTTFILGDVKLVARRLEGTFLDYKSAFPHGEHRTVTADTTSLISTIERVDVMISENARGVMRCTFENGAIPIRSTTFLGSAMDKCYMTGDGGGLEMGFNSRFLLDAVRNAPSGKVRLELFASDKPCVIRPSEGNSYLAMVLPVRLSGGTMTA